MNTSTPVNNDLSLALEAVFRGLIPVVASTSTPPDTTQLIIATRLLQRAFDEAGPELSIEVSLTEALHRLTGGPRQDEELAAPDPGDASQLNAEPGPCDWVIKVDDEGSERPPLPAEQRTAAELEHEHELAYEFSVMFREALRAISAGNPRGATLNVVRSFVEIVALLNAGRHNFYYYYILEEAFAAFKDSPKLRDLDIGKLALARAGMRYFATRTDQDDRARNRQSRLSGDDYNLERSVVELVRSDAWKNLPRLRDRIPGV